MLRSYSFYEERFNISPQIVNECLLLISELKDGIIKEDRIREYGLPCLKIALGEYELNTFLKLIRPYEYVENGVVYQRYLIDALSSDILNFITYLPESFLEAYNKANEDEKYYHPESNGVGALKVARTAIIINAEVKKRLLDALLHVPSIEQLNFKIKDILPRQISGWGYPIETEADVAQYCELPSYYPALALFKKNIHTTYNDTAGCIGDEWLEEASINLRIDYAHLSDENKLYADALVQRGKAQFIEERSGLLEVEIVLPCSKEDTVEETNARLMPIINGFKKQDLLHKIIPFETIVNDIKAYLKYMRLAPDLKTNIISLIETGEPESLNEALRLLKNAGFDFEFYYDAANNIYWSDEKSFKKHLAFVDNKPNTELALA